MEDHDFYVKQTIETNIAILTATRRLLRDKQESSRSMFTVVEYGEAIDTLNKVLGQLRSHRSKLNK